MGQKYLKRTILLEQKTFRRPPAEHSPLQPPSPSPWRQRGINHYHHPRRGRERPVWGGPIPHTLPAPQGNPCWELGRLRWEREGGLGKPLCYCSPSSWPLGPRQPRAWPHAVLVVRCWLAQDFISQVPPRRDQKCFFTPCHQDVKMRQFSSPPCDLDLSHE